MFEEIKNSENWKIIEPVKKGWSSDQKYYIKTFGNQELLLRISDKSLLEKRSEQFALLKKVNELNINAPKPIDFGVLNDKQIYTLLSWVPGESAETAILDYTPDEQYSLGIDAGKIMAKIHSVPVEYDGPNWSEIYYKKMKRKIKNVNDCSVILPNKDLIIKYIEENIHLVENREMKCAHGDFHLGNMVIDNGKIGVIDFDKLGVSDPYDDFKPYCWNVFRSCHFETGLIDGYFNSKVPNSFFKILSLYSAESLISHLPWATTFGETEVKTALNVAKHSLEWFNHYEDIVPSFYLGELKNKNK